MSPIRSSQQTSLIVALEEWFKRTVAAILQVFFRAVSTEGFNLSDVRNILIVRQHDQLGDMLCVVPLLRALRSRFPQAHMTLVASPVNFAVMQHHPYVNEVLNYDKAEYRRAPWRLFSFLRMIRNRRFDLAVVPCTVSISMTSNLIALASRARIRVGPASLNGIANPTAFVFNINMPLQWDADARRHQTLRNLDILKPLDIVTDDLGCLIGFTKEELTHAERLLSALRQNHKVLIGFHPGAGKEENRWPADRFAEVADRLAEEFSAAAIITHGPVDDEVVNAMMRHLRCPHLVLRRQPIRTVAAVISRLNLFITNDTGIMHVAGACRVPVLSLFGPTDPHQWAPIHAKNRFLTGASHDVQLITVDEVLRAARATLSLFLMFLIL